MSKKKTEKQILDQNYADFSSDIMAIKEKEKIIQLLSLEQQGQKRSSFMGRLHARVRQLASEEIDREINRT